MRPDHGPPPDKGMAWQRLDRVRAAVRTAPLPVKIVLVAALLAAAVLASHVPGWVGGLAQAALDFRLAGGRRVGAGRDPARGLPDTSDRTPPALPAAAASVRGGR